jgi:hypothetical protein
MNDGFIKSPDAALRGILRRCGERPGTPYFPRPLKNGFAAAQNLFRSKYYDA